MLDTTLIAVSPELSTHSRALIQKKKLKFEITRFKGLGEISPKEFKQFIGDDIRLQQVSIDKLSEVPMLLEFYMGKNTPERKAYIMTNLVDEPGL